HHRVEPLGPDHEVAERRRGRGAVGADVDAPEPPDGQEAALAPDDLVGEDLHRQGPRNNDKGANMYQTAAAEPAVAGAAGRENVMVWDRKQTGHYEVWYLTWNHLPTRTGFWLRYVIEAPGGPVGLRSTGGRAKRSPLKGYGAPYAQVWFAFFDGKDPRSNFGLHDTHTMAELADAAAPFRIAIGAAELGHDHARGAIEGAGHSARWDLLWLPSPTTHHQLPEIFYKRQLGGTMLVSPNL